MLIACLQKRIGNFFAGVLEEAPTQAEIGTVYLQRRVRLVIFTRTLSSLLFPIACVSMQSGAALSVSFGVARAVDSTPRCLSLDPSWVRITLSGRKRYTKPVRTFAFVFVLFCFLCVVCAWNFQKHFIFQFSRQQCIGILGLECPAPALQYRCGPTRGTNLLPSSI